MYPGALLSLDEDPISIGLTTADGRCLEDAQFGGPVESGTGGNVPIYLAVDAGATAIVGSRQPPSGCRVPADIGPVDVSLEAGGRVGLFPYGTDPATLQFLVLPMS
jgi:hypothetical protein